MRKPKFEIVLDDGFISKTRSVDKVILGALVAAMNDTVDGSRSLVGLKVAKRYGVRMKPSFRQIMEGTVEEIREGTPVDTGELQRGWKLKESRKTGRLVYTIVNDAPPRPPQYPGGAPLNSADLINMLEFGTKPHKIAPVKKKSLSDQARGGTFFSRRAVSHPGINKGKNAFVGWIGRARRKMRARSTKALQGLATRWVANANGAFRK